MGNLTSHVSRHELACRCGCGFDAVDLELAGVIEDCVSHFEAVVGHRLAVHFNSGNRCAGYNGTVNGAAAGSQHTKGIACDFRISGVPADTVADYLEGRFPDRYGIGRYMGRTHIDVRLGMARWDKRK